MDQLNHIPGNIPDELSNVGPIFHTDSISCCGEGPCGDEVVLLLHTAATDVQTRYQQAAKILGQTAATVRTWHHKDQRVGQQVQQRRRVSSNRSALGGG